MNDYWSSWWNDYEAHRFDDEAHEQDEPREPIHARADIDARTFPCGVDARAMVEVGSDADVTCDGCRAELQRRENLQATVLRASAALVIALCYRGRSHHPITTALRNAMHAKNYAAIGGMASDVLAFAYDLFWARNNQEIARRFIDAVNDAGLNRSRGSLQEALDAMPPAEPTPLPF